jgi:hypothetical protein
MCSDHSCGDLNFGGGFLGISKSARIGCSSWLGHAPSAISIRVMPVYSIYIYYIYIFRIWAVKHLFILINFDSYERESVCVSE